MAGTMIAGGVIVCPAVIVRRRPGGVRRDALLDDLVEFTPAEPDPTATGAIVDFHILSFRHEKIDSTLRAHEPGGCIGGPVLDHACLHVCALANRLDYSGSR